MTDWYVSLPHATGLVTVKDGRVVKAPPIFRWMIRKPWQECKATITKKKGARVEALPNPLSWYVKYSPGPGQPGGFEINYDAGPY